MNKKDFFDPEHQLNLADPTLDFSFKKMFCTKGVTAPLIDFIESAIWPDGEVKIATIEYKEPTLRVNGPDQSWGVLDLLCTDNNGNQYNVEMQNSKPNWSDKRAVFYASGAYFQQNEFKVGYSELKPTYCISILNFTQFPMQPKDQYKSTFYITEEKSGHRIKEIVLIFLELEKFSLELQKIGKEFERWAYFLKNHRNPEAMKAIAKESEPIMTALELIDRNKWTGAELDEYRALKKNDMDRHAMLSQALEEGLEQGLRLGRKEGLNEGLEQGQLKVAKKMLSAGFSIDQIKDLTGLKISSIEKLKSD